jgi:hypothetical protein
MLRLRWSTLSSSELDQVLGLISRPTGQPAVLTPSLADKLKRLPLFETLAGEKRVALLPPPRVVASPSSAGATAASSSRGGFAGFGGFGASAAAGVRGGASGGGSGGAGGVGEVPVDGGGASAQHYYYTVEGGGGGAQGLLLDAQRGVPLPLSAKQRFLVPKAELQDVYRDLGVPALSESGVLTRFLLPAFAHMAVHEQDALLKFVRDGWGTLKAGDPAFVEAMGRVAFVPTPGAGTDSGGGGGGVGNSGGLAKPSELLDPAHPLLSVVFDDDPRAFPPSPFNGKSVFEEGSGGSNEELFPSCNENCEAWPPILRELGLRGKVDRDTFLQSARHVEGQRSDPLEPRVEEKASLLLRYLIEHESDFFEPAFARALGTISFVPVECTDFFNTGRNGGGTGDAGGSSGNGVGGGSTVLVSFSEAAVPKDRHLVWTAMPVIPPHLVPPQMMWSSLGVNTPPSVEVVVRHLRCLVAHPSLDRWPFPNDSPTAVFQSLYAFLDEHWERVSPAVKAGLRESPCVPVGFSLVKASRVYFRMGSSAESSNLAPFMFEVPRAFGGHDKLLKALGAKQTPTAADYQVRADKRGVVGYWVQLSLRNLNYSKAVRLVMIRLPF